MSKAGRQDGDNLKDLLTSKGEIIKEGGLLAYNEDLSTAPLTVYLDPHRILHTKAEPVTEISDLTQRHLSRMLATLRTSQRGLAIAANQVGLLQRMVVIDPQNPRLEFLRPYLGDEPLFLINPWIVEKSEGDTVRFSEGCLSAPGFRAVTDMRWRFVQVAFFDLHGHERQIIADNDHDATLSVMLQHELSHLDGMMYWHFIGDAALRERNVTEWLAMRERIHSGKQSVPYHVVTHDDRLIMSDGTGQA